jgi:hypothetical protein
MGKNKDRKTYKPLAKRNHLSPNSIKGRRDAAPKSQSRVKSSNKFMSQERDKPEVPKLTAGAMTTGFKNYRQNKYNPKERDSNNLSIKHTGNTRFSKKKRSVSKDVIGGYRIPYPTVVYSEMNQKAHNDLELHELDEKCQDISEIEIDLEDHKGKPLYQKPYQGYGVYQEN